MEKELNYTSGENELIENSTSIGLVSLSKQIGSIAKALPFTLAVTGAVATYDGGDHVKEAIVPTKNIQLGASASITQDLQDIINRYEVVEVSYHAKVASIEYNNSGDPKYAIINVAIDGKNTIIKKSYQQFDFDLSPEMSLVVEGVNRGGVKQLKFRKVKQIQLDDEQKNLISQIATSFV